MIIDAYTFCWNEEIRLKYYLNLYAPICRKITIYDNGSTDASEEIAKQYDNVVWDTTTYGQNQIDNIIKIEITNNCWKQSSADLVLIGDMDEILYHPSGLKNYFDNALSSGKTVLIPFAYDMVSESLPTHDGNIYDKDDFKYGFRIEREKPTRRTLERKWNRCLPGRTKPNPGFRYWYDKQCVFSPKKIKSMGFWPGCHFSYPSPRRNVKTLYEEHFKLLHYKFLSKDYYCKRNLFAKQRVSKNNKEHNLSWHYMVESEVTEKKFEDAFSQRTRII